MLRHWDDLAKGKGAQVPSLNHYMAHLEMAARQFDMQRQT